MERVFHKKTELLNFAFINTDDEHITSSNNILKIYELSFYLDQVKLSLNTKYIEV